MNDKVMAAIIGPGNIGSDLMIKVLRNAKHLEMGAMVGVDPSSDGLARAERLGIPTTSEGVDLSAVLKEPSKPARAVMMFAYRNVQRALRDEQWKLIRYPPIDRTQLFDLKADPHERTNLADRPEHAKRVAAMTATLGAEMQRLGDPVTLSVANPKPAAWTPPSATTSPKR